MTFGMIGRHKTMKHMQGMMTREKKKHISIIAMRIGYNNHA